MLQRLGNRFLCPLCREKATAEALSTKRTNRGSQELFARWRSQLCEIRRAASLVFLALVVTGFIVIPAIFDPQEVSRPQEFAARGPASNREAGKI